MNEIIPILYLVQFRIKMAVLKTGAFFLFFLFLNHLVNADGITSIAKTNKLLQSAETALKKKAFKEAIDSYNGALKENPDLPPQVQMNLASAYYQTKEYSKAQKHYLSVASNVNSPGLKSAAYQQIGNIYFNQQNYTTALEWYKKSLMTNPENENARFNYELAYKLKKKAEAENQKNPEKQKGDKNQPEKQEKNKDSSKKEKGDPQKEPSKKQDGDEKKEQGQKQDKKEGGQNQKSPQKGDEKKGDEQPGEKQSDVNKKQEGGQEEKPGDPSDEKSKNKTQESNMDDPESQRMDKEKLREAGLTEEQAKSLLQAMRQNEVKYLQQRRFKSSKGGRDRSKEKY